MESLAGEEGETEREEEAVELPSVVSTQRYLWCIDNGHGKETAGKRSPVLDDGRQLFEYEFNRIISDLLMKRLEQRGVAYFNVVPEVNEDIGLQERVNRANNAPGTLPKVFVSIHANASTNGGWETRDIQGTETWYYGNSTAGKRIASAFQSRIIRKIQTRDRGIRYHEPVSRSFFVLRKTPMPAVLLECGFYTTQSECIRLLDPDTQERLASALAEAIIEMEENGYEGVALHPKVVKIVKS